MKKKISIKKPILNANDQLALKHQKLFDQTSTLAINIMASPGAGKTTFVTETIKRLKPDFNISVIEGDVVEVDVDKIKKLNTPVTLANTGGACHLDAVMVQKALPKIDLEKTDLLIVENVGNLICPMNFKLGTHLNIVIASVPEGDDKPYKYPGMFKGADVLILNKIDYLKLEDFDQDYFQKGVERLNQDLEFFPLSSKTGQGFDSWTKFLRKQLQQKLNR